MSIQEHLNKIRNAIKGSEVRESIAKGIETAYDDASEKDNANMEVKIARGTHPNLRSRLEEVDNKQQQTTTQLAERPNKGEIKQSDLDKNAFGFDATWFSENFLTDLNNGEIHTTVLQSESVLNNHIANRAVSEEKTTFFGKVETVYEATDYSEGSLFLIEPSGVFVPVVLYPFGTLVFPVEPNNYYKIKVLDSELQDRLRVGVSQKEVPFQVYDSDLDVNEPVPPGYETIKQLISVGNIVDEFEFTTGEYDEFIYINTGSERPSISVTEYKLKKSRILDEGIDTRFLDKTVNLFEGDYRNIGLGANVPHNVLRTDGMVSAVIPIEGGETYYLRRFEPSDRLRVGLSPLPFVNEGLSRMSRNITDGIDGNPMTLEIPTEVGEKVMIIYLSTKGEEPKIQVTKGVDYEYYLPPFKLTDKGKKLFQTQNQTDNGKNDTSQRKFFTLGSPTVYLSEQNTINPNTRTLESLQAVYDSLEDSDLVSVETRGQDGLGNDIKAYTIEKPTPSAVDYQNYDNYNLDLNKRNKMKIIIIGGVHGNEKSSQVGLSKFIEKLVEDTEDKNLEFIRNNLILKVIPLVNPSGIKADIRANHNGFDLNRDYNTQNQNEIKIVVDYINENKDALALLDYHDSARSVSFWPAEENQVYHDIFYTVMANINDYWTKENPTINNPVGEIVVNPTTTNSQAYAHNLGMLGIIVESPRSSESLNGGEDWYWNTEAVKYGNDLLINTILTIMNYYR